MPENYVEPKSYDEMIEWELKNDFKGFTKTLEYAFFYKTKSGLLDFFNKKIPDKLNKRFKESDFKKYLSWFLNNATLNPKKHKKKQKYRGWQVKLIKNTHLNFSRKIFIFKDRFLPKSSPFVDRAIGNLYISEHDYKHLKKNDLIYYLMLHEASHVAKNIVSYEAQLLQSLESLKKRSGSLCLLLPNKNCQLEMQKLFGSFDIQPVIKYTSHVEELSIDLHAMKTLSRQQQDNYLLMLKSLIPNEYQSRLSLVNKYKKLTQSISELGFTDEQLRNSFLLYKLNNSDDFVISINMFLYKIRKFKFDKYFMFITNTINLDMFYKKYKDFQRLNKILKGIDTSKDFSQYTGMVEL